jgi:RimJ/RimL family protein N-acetyltransferase
MNRDPGVRKYFPGLLTQLAALEFGFRELHLDTVVAFAVEANTGSRRVMEKVGLVYSSDFDRPSIPELSPLRRHVLYSLKRANWYEKSSPIRILV